MPHHPAHRHWDGAKRDDAAMTMLLTQTLER
jgi:hypothetical protein